MDIRTDPRTKMPKIETLKSVKRADLFRDILKCRHRRINVVKKREKTAGMVKRKNADIRPPSRGEYLNVAIPINNVRGTIKRRDLVQFGALKM